MIVDFPAQPLDSALTELADRAGLRLLYQAETVGRLRSQPVSGARSPEQALNVMLADSGLQYRKTGSDAITIEKAPAPAAKTEGNVMQAVTVTGSADFDSTDPHNPHYNRTNSVTATKLDTPIMETPMSIKVVPKAVMDDQQIVVFDDAVVRNISGVQRNFDFGDLYQGFIVRGFSLGANIYRDGLRQYSGYFEPAGMERIEVLKGAAAMLYGRTQPGGLVNY